MKFRLTLTLVPFVLLVLAGCGKKETAAPMASNNAPATPAAPAQPAAPAVLEVEITANDAMKFNVTRIEAKPGQDVKVVLVNIGTMPKVAMGHNWVLLKKGVDAKAFITAAQVAAASEYFPADKADQVIAHTKLLGPRQTDEVTFKAPTEPGEYEYLCSFPAHYVAGMKGVLVVK
ncbi:MAG TPA: azurin [Opitutaceae bacterium]|nr:azurin [Opitutaceae bacterium]